MRIVGEGGAAGHSREPYVHQLVYPTSTVKTRPARLVAGHSRVLGAHLNPPAKNEGTSEAASGKAKRLDCLRSNADAAG